MKAILRISFVILIVTLVYPPAFAEKVLEIKLPITSKYKERDDYKINLLKLVLEKAGVDYTLNFRDEEWTQARIISMLGKNSDKINLYWVGTSAEFEKRMRPVRFPVYRGLLGHRIFIIHRDDQKKFDKVNKLGDLKKLKGIQGIGWSDIKILEHSGLRQNTGKYENIFKMVNRGGRVEYFSRGVNEAFMEVEARAGELKNLAVEKKIMLVYPFAMFFFTCPTCDELAMALEKGFTKSYEDGSFINFFKNRPEISKIFNQANIEKRVRFDIPNPLLTKETSAISDKYWHGRQ